MKDQQTFRSAMLIAATSILASCASPPTQDQLANANYGRYMTPRECTVIAEDTITRNFFDPNSAQFKHDVCYEGWWSSVPLQGMEVAFGWMQTGEVNAKNRYGGYVGFSPYRVLIRDGRAIRYCFPADALCTPRTP